MESKLKVLNFFRFCFILIFIFSLVAPATTVRAQDELPPEVTEPTQVVEEPTEPVAEPTEEASVDATLPEEVIIPVEVVEPPVEEVTVDLVETVELLADTGTVLVDENGETIPLASADAAEIISSADPYFISGGTTYYFMPPGGCTSAYTDGVPTPEVCTESGTPIQATLNYITANSITPDGMIVYVLPGTYNEAITINIAGLTLYGNPGTTTIAGAAINAPILNGTGTGTGITINAQGVTVTGFIIQNFDVGIYINVSSGNIYTHITNNTIQNNNIGIAIAGGTGAPGSHIHYNAFYNNTLYALQNSAGSSGTQMVPAQYNYWGCVLGPIVQFVEGGVTKYILWADPGTKNNPKYINPTLPAYQGCQKLNGYPSEWNFQINTNDYSPYKIQLNLDTCPDTDNDGICDRDDGCPNDPAKTAPGLCGCGVSDADTDSDGSPDCLDGCPTDPNKFSPGICGCGVADTDSDGDGTLNCNDGCPTDPLKVAPGACGCGVADTDGDGDGVPNCNDGCPTDPLKVAPGICGCGVADTDTDGDGTADCNDDCPLDANKLAAGICGCGVSDVDTDQDGTADCNDGCPLDANKLAAGICGCGVSDVDTDQDGTADCNDGCPLDANKLVPGICGCGVADTDTDGDGTADCNDDCPLDANKLTPGVCGCGVSDVDTDLDDTADCHDACPEDPNKVEGEGVCGCGVADTDSDQDGVADCNDVCPQDPNKSESAGECGCGVADTDVDGDGVAGCNDNCPVTYNPTQADADGDGIGDACDGGGGPDPAVGGIIPVTGGTLIGSGIGHSCMTTAEGMVICWGLNSAGQLGDGSYADSDVPVFVFELDSVFRLAIGANHNCALKNDGSVWCWGENGSGQLGDGTNANSNVPVLVNGLPGIATDITAGENFTCANMEDGSIWCWGENGSGQLNDGSKENQSTPVKSEFETLPAQISGGMKELVAESGGAVSLWTEKKGVGIEGLVDVLNISGNRFAAGGCAAGLDGKVFCWGEDGKPVEVADVADAIAVGAGQEHSCDVDSGQLVSCWGKNPNGELGDGTNEDSAGAKAVVELGPITALGVGAHHTCVLMPDGNAMCWGDNTWGQLGNDTNTDSNKPVLVILPKRPIE